MHPNVIAVSQVGHGYVCKSLVRFAIRRHGFQVEVNFVELVVKQWPDCGICHRS
jgi:pyridoxal/pyridoxine/pyridoxamine kinase